MQPIIFIADPEAVGEGKAFKPLGFLALMMPRTGGRGVQFANYLNNDLVVAGDEIMVYEDHLERKHGEAIQEIFFRDIAGIVATRSPAGKLLFFEIDETEKKTMISGMDKMEDLLALIIGRLPPSESAQRVVTLTLDGPASARKMIVVFGLLAIVLMLFVLIGNALLSK
jgi:hypothetical protein